MNIERLKRARKLAEEHPGKASRIILALCDEVDKLRRMTLRKGLAPIGAEEPWPYEPYLGVPMCEVPEDHLIDWMKRQNRKGIRFDVDYAAVALRDLLLYDYIYKLATPIPETPPVAENDKPIAENGKADPIPETEGLI